MNLKKTHNIVSEVIKMFKEKINESSREDKLLKPFVDFFASKGINCTTGQLKQFFLSKFVNEASMNNLSLESNYYLAGVIRYYLNGDLTTNKVLNAIDNSIKDNFNVDICKRLNELILILRNSYIDSVGTTFEQPEDFGTLSIAKLLRKYGKKINQSLGLNAEEDKPKEQNTDNHVGNGYTFEILYSYDEAKKYNVYTLPMAWCITYGQHHFNSYMNGNSSTNYKKIHYVIFRKDGFENVPRKKGPNWTSRKPQDEYGNSLIALLQNNNTWLPNCITSRWNHGASEDHSECEADHAYTTQEFMDITGVSEEDLKRIYRIWSDNCKAGEKILTRSDLNKEKLQALRIFKYAQIRINGGNISNAFGDYQVIDWGPLTNIEKIKNLTDDALRAHNVGDSNSFEKIRKIREKAILSSIRSGCVVINGEKWQYLMDGKKILFDTIKKVENDYYAPFQSSENSRGYWGFDASYYENAILCKVTNGYMIYDTRRHEFLEIDGVKKFKFLTDIHGWDKEKDVEGIGGFYEVKMSSMQMALVDIKTNKPLVLPNGSSWFESIENMNRYYGREVRCNYISSSNNILVIMYDSSSRESYWYDMRTKSFFDPKQSIDFCDCKDVKTCGFLPFGITRLGITLENGYCLYGLMKDKKIIPINGNKLFASIKYGENGLLTYSVKDDDKNRLYDILNNKEYEVPDIMGKNPHLANDGMKLLEFRIYLNGFSNNRSLYFSVKNRIWLKNPLDGSLVFRTYGQNLDSGYITLYTDEVSYDREKFVLSNDETYFISEEELIKDNQNKENMHENKNTKRLILTRKQLNEVLNEVDYYVNTGEAGNNNSANAIKQLSSADASQEYTNLNTKVPGEDPGVVVGSHSKTTNAPNVYAGEANSLSDIATKISQDPTLKTAIDAGATANFEIDKSATNEVKSFSKKQIEEARLKKIHEGYKMTKKQLMEHWEEKPNDDANQWNEEYEMFMYGLRHGDYELTDDVLFVEIFKGRTSDNDPRYVYIRKGENRLHDDHFYIQNSPVLNDTDLKDIYYNAGWEDVLPELVDYNGFEMYESKIEISPKNKGKFNATKKRTGKSTEELTHSKNPITKKRAIFAQNAKKWKKKKSKLNEDYDNLRPEDGYRIGFTNAYFTLWNCRKVVRQIDQYRKETYYRNEYIKNISMSKEKTFEKYPDLPYDETLKGHTRSFDTRPKEEWTDNTVFRFGKYCYEHIEDVDDPEYIAWYYRQTYGEHAEYVESVLTQKYGYEVEHKEFGTYLKSPEEQAAEKEHQRKLGDTRSKLENHEPISLIPDRNLSYYGYYYVNEENFWLHFNEVKEMYYNGYNYYLPAINGKGKKFKGKNILITDYDFYVFNNSEDEDSGPSVGDFVVDVKSFEVQK